MTLLERITSDDFIVSVGFDLPSRAMRKVLLNTPECREFRDMYRSGVLTEGTLRRYVRELMGNLTIGQRCPYDTALALMAVGLEPSMDKFADEYLSELSKLELVELPVSISVAKECLAERARLPSNITRQFVWPGAIPCTMEYVFHEKFFPEKAGLYSHTFEAA
jgi:hypothetical protein